MAFRLQPKEPCLLAKGFPVQEPSTLHLSSLLGHSTRHFLPRGEVSYNVDFPLLRGISGLTAICLSQSHTCEPTGKCS